MFFSTFRLSTILTCILMLSNTAYGERVSKDPNIIPLVSTTLLDLNKNSINSTIEKKQKNLLQIQKTDTMQYLSLYDNIAALIISKNNTLLKIDRTDDIDTDKTCNFVLQYEETEFIKTQYYKTPFHKEVAKTLQNIASLYEQCHPPMAKKYLESVLKIKEHIYGKKSLKTAKSYDALGDYYRIYMANFKNAITEYENANQIRKKLYGVKDPRITENYARLALSLYYFGDKTNRAEKLLLDSIVLREKALPNKDFPIYVAYMNAGIYYSMKDEYNRSINYLEKAFKSFQGKKNNNYITIVSELSQNYLNQNDLPNALKFGEKAYKASKEFYQSDTHYQVLENSLRLIEIKNRMKK